jgi:hypothetical protein
MRNDLPRSGPKEIWLTQPTEIRIMTWKLIQQKLRALRARTRRKLLGTLAGPAAVAAVYALGVKQFGPHGQSLEPLFAFALAWSLAGLFFLNRGMWSAMTPADAGLSTGLESCRHEIERQRDLVRRALLWSLAPVLLAIAALIVALASVGSRERGIFPNGLPFLSLVVLWIITYFFIRLREQRNLQRELDDLNDIENEKRAL